MNKSIYLIATVLTLLSSSVIASQIKTLGDTPSHLTLEVTEKYVLGDNDTLIDARNLSIEQAKKSASDYAGTYVEQSLVVDDNKITKQQIRVLTAGFLEVLSTTEQRSLDQSGKVTLTTKAVIRLSKQSVQDGLSKLKTDPDRLSTILRLEEQNQYLRDEISRLNGIINPSDSQSPKRIDLIDKRDGLLLKLDQNRTSVRQIFAQGTLFQIAKQNNKEFDRAKQTLHEQIFDYFKYNTEIIVGTPEFLDNGDGTYNMMVSVTWNTPYGPTKSFFGKHFDVVEPAARNSFQLSLSKHKNSGNNQKVAYTKSLYDELTSQSISIRISVGSYSADIPLSATVDSFDTLNTQNGYIHRIQFKADDATRKYVHGNVENPVVLKNIPAAELSYITTISADVVIKPVSKK
ncbi:hypothetical protein ACFM0N_004074 [Vibrio parahaemolyticus]|jgi:hypothetical protein|uniref:Uncharacterized protein n=2 Tax=Vibrio cyclitrophicus TaxID=47951 RepID=A0A7Z1MD98_9VIBR|nr:MULTISPECIES: hypothetical protein [Vibrio]KOE87579.1 hypothetical protein ACS86_02845 [Vibrio alginolyticus]HDM8244533.1 hypothetical protein [Vibrio campbellii]EHH1074825.1 hypothetical protein [Vibrio parahaemolyticus]EJG1732824.1 hypothetical protein [Vibrio parahaemolyticus]ELA9297110.1 hypothetical protein [Vibrio parahaemolyticus]